jgi:hypothetical protein
MWTILNFSERSTTRSKIRLGRTVTRIHRFCEALEVIFEQMCAPIEGDLGRRMNQHSLHCFHPRSGRNRPAGGSVSQVVRHQIAEANVG